jgi:hypothetical protein
LADGRLDEAYDLVRRSDVRAHRRGQELLQKLVRSLIDRGRRHLAQGNFSAASGDVDKVIQLAGNLPDALQLREAIRTAQHGVEKVNRQAAQVIAIARRHAEQGQLTVGQQVLDESPVADSRLDGLRQDLAARRAGLEDALKKATAAFDGGQWEAAIDLILTTGRGGVQDASLRRLAHRIADHVAAEATPLVQSGRLDAAAALMSRLEPLRTETTATRQLRTTLEECGAVSSAIAAGQQHEAEIALLRLKAMWPRAGWIGELAEQTKQWGQVQTAIKNSPLLLLKLSPRQAPQMPTPVKTPTPTAPLPQAESLVLHVDGVGSFRIFTGSKVSIGPLSSTRALDLPLMIDAAAPTITLSRSDDDYFLNAERPVSVNSVPRATKLLSSGDRIELGGRCRLAFRRPSAASGTAVLEISGARLPTAGSRQVILLDREIVIGPGAGAHIRADQLSAPVVLVRGDSGFVCRSAAEIQIDGRLAGANAILPPGAHVTIGSLSFVISREERP